MFRGAFPDNSESLLAVSRVACGSGTGDHQTGAVRLRWGEMEGWGVFFPRVGCPTTPFSRLLFLHAVYSGGEKQEELDKSGQSTRASQRASILDAPKQRLSFSASPAA